LTIPDRFRTGGNSGVSLVRNASKCTRGYLGLNNATYGAPGIVACDVM
jgi:hypothetical protein